MLLARRFVLFAVLALNALGGVLAQESSPPWTVRAGGGLGVALVSMPRLADYANVVGSPVKRIEDFASAAELVLVGEVRLTDLWSAGVYYGRIAKTIEAAEPASTGWAFDATMQMPMVLVRRAMDAGPMSLQITVGGGPYSGELVQRYGPAGSDQRFSGRGLGLLAGAAAFAPLDAHVVAGLSADIRWSGVGRLTDAAGREPSHRGVTADMRWTHLSLQFLIAAQF